MKLANIINRKIKFREADYVERHYIREDGKAVIPIELDHISNLYMMHDYKKLMLSDEVCNYIEEVAYIIPFKYDIVLEIHCNEITTIEQEKIKRVIKNNYGMEIDDIDYDIKVSDFAGLGYFFVGIGLLFIPYLLPNSISDVVREFFVIAGWVALWQTIESILVTNNKRKIDRLNKLQLYDSQIEFIFKTNEDNQ